MSLAVAEIIDEHRRSGERFEVPGANSFVRREGEGEPVVLMHGVPVSSFLYRKVLTELSRRGLHAVAFDLPGLGLADRPTGFDYSWSGLAAWTADAIDALEIDRCHLVVHDIGGPVGFEWAIRHPERVISLTALDTLVDAGSFHRPWTMHPFSIRGLGEIWLRATPRFLFSELFYLQGVGERAAVPRAEIYAHRRLLLGPDRGEAFLKIMRGFELTAEKERFYRDGLTRRGYPAQVVWGSRDPALGEERRRAVQEALGVERATLLDARHFPQEDRPAEVAAAIASLASP